MEIVLDLLEAGLPYLIGFAVGLPAVAAVLGMLKEVKELLDVLLKALEDDNLTKEELQAIAKEAKDVKASWKAVLKAFKKKKSA